MSLDWPPKAALYLLRKGTLLPLRKWMVSSTKPSMSASDSVDSFRAQVAWEEISAIGKLFYLF